MEKRKILAGGGLVLNDAGELLMIFRRGKWDIPKGKLDEGETIEDCALREVKEETGLQDVERGELVAVSYHTYFDTYIQEEVVKESHWFWMYAKGNQQLVPQVEEDIQQIEWVNKQRLEQHLLNSYDNVIEVIRKAGLLK